MNSHSIHELDSRVAAEHENVIEPGDVLLIIKADGNVVPMTIVPDMAVMEGVRTKDQADYTEAEAALAYQGQMLFLLSMAASSPVLMNILAEISNAPGVIDMDKIKSVVTMH